ETGDVLTRVTMPRSVSSSNEVVERIDHIGVACDDNVATTEVFSGRLGFAVESTQTDMEVQMAVESFTSDKYGVVYHSRAPETVGGLRVSFITVGDCELELLQPFNPSGAAGAEEGPARDAPGNTRGDKGAIGRYIARRGPGLHHLALKTPDINATLDRLAQAGLDMIDTVGRPGSRRALIGFVHPRALGGLLLHFVERDEL
ncbi:MAG: VOC family protein, partial [Acidiferrobacterales bacterium]